MSGVTTVVPPHQAGRKYWEHLSRSVVRRRPAKRRLEGWPQTLLWILRDAVFVTAGSSDEATPVRAYQPGR